MRFLEKSPLCQLLPVNPGRKRRRGQEPQVCSRVGGIFLGIKVEESTIFLLVDEKRESSLSLST